MNDGLKYGEPFNPYGMFEGICIPNGIVDSDLSDSEKILLGKLYKYGGPDGKCFPSRERLASDLHWLVRKLDRNIKSLKEKGLITTYQVNEHSPSNYVFLFDGRYNSFNIDPDYAPKCNGKRVIGTVKNDSRGTVIRDRGATVINDKHKVKEKKVKERRNSVSLTNRKIIIKRNDADASLNDPADHKEEDSNNDLAIPKKESARERLQKAKQVQEQEPVPNIIFVIPKRTESIIDYWNNKKVLPKIRINLDNPTKVLKQTVKTLSLFFNNKLYSAAGSANLPANVSRAEILNLNKLSTPEELRTLIDMWCDLLTSNKYKINSAFLSKITLLQFLMGDQFVNNGNGGLYCPILLYLIRVVPLKTVDSHPETTEVIRALWMLHLKQGIVDADLEKVIKASSVVNEFYNEKKKKRPDWKISTTKFYGADSMVCTLIVSNKDYLKSIKADVSILSGNWAKKEYEKNSQSR